MLRYRWPGNVRELRTAIEHAVVFCRGDKVGSRDLPAAVRELPSGPPPQVSLGPKLTVKAAEKELIIRALKEEGGNRTLAAKKLGMSRRTLHRKIAAYHLEGY